MQLIVAEKPSVARDLARVLGVRAQGKDRFESDGTVITWCVGHLVELDEPGAYDPRWKHWRMDTLPMLPAQFKLRPATGAPGQFRAVRALLRERRFDEVVNACDAGREGELIFRYVYDLAGSRLPVRRLWISSLTDEAIRAGFAQLRPGARYDALGDAARCRSEADWLVGMNATRALTLKSRRPGERGTLWSIGRVQTPTLALIVAREAAIRAFVPVNYHEVRGTFGLADSTRFVATYAHERKTRFGRPELARALVERVAAHARGKDPVGPRVERIAQKTVREPAPLLFDLTSLQRTANRRYGFSAARTLEIAQSLYETRKALTYPRTDSRHLTQDVARELPRVFASLEPHPDYAAAARQLVANPPRISRRVFDDTKVQDHHAIIPTGKAVALASLDADERKIFDLVVRRFLGVFFPDAEFAITDVTVRVGPAEGTEPAARGDGAPDDKLLDALPPPPDRFHARGRVRTVAGWQDVAGIDGSDEPASTQNLPALREGDALDGAFEAVAGKTVPPHRHTEATLLSAMEGAGRAMEDDALREAMKDRGLGTPATRAAVIETLLKRGFVAREKKHVVPTPLGISLIESLPVASLGSAELTGAWEARLVRVARGEESRGAFMADIASYVREVVTAIQGASPPPAAGAAGPASVAGAAVGRCPRCGGTVTERARDYACATGATPCGLAIPRVIAGRAVSPALAGVLLGQRRTQTLRGFRSKAGRPFAAALVLDTAGAVGFEFGAASEPSAPSPRPRPAAAPPATTPTVSLDGLECPRCKNAGLTTGRRAWGCARWREGCTLTVPFEVAGRVLSEALLRELVIKGRTRKARFRPGNGPPVTGRLVLDVFGAPGETVRFESDPIVPRARRAAASEAPAREREAH